MVSSVCFPQPKRGQGIKTDGKENKYQIKDEKKHRRRKETRKRVCMRNKIIY